MATRAEREEQIEVVDWLDEHGIVFFAVPNERNARFSREGYFHGRPVNTKMGARKGVPDLVVVTLAANGRPTAIEMKCSDGSERNLSAEQVEWRRDIREAGWNYVLGLGSDSAIFDLRSMGYGSPIEEGEKDCKGCQDCRPARVKKGKR